MKSMVGRPIMAIVALAGIAVMAGSLPSTGAPALFDLKISAIPYDITALSDTVALEQRYFEKYGLKVTLQAAIGGNQGTTAVLAGNAPITNSSPAPAFAAIVRGADLVSFATSFPVSPYLLLSRVPAAQIQQFGVSGPGLSADRAAAFLTLRRLAVDPTKVAFIPIGATTARLAAVEQGTVQATMVPLYVAVNYDRQKLTLLADTAAMGLPYVVDQWITTRQFYAENIRVIEAFSKAIIEANAFILAPRNKVAVIHVLKDPRGSGFTDAQAEAAYTFAVKYNIKKYPRVNRDGLRTVLEALAAVDPQMGKVDLDKYVMDEPLHTLERIGFADQFYR